MNKRAAHIEWVRSSTGLFLMVTILASIVFYIFVIPPADRELLLDGIENKSVTLLDISPGEITKATQELERESISLSDVQVDNSKHTLQELVSNQFVLSSNMFENTVAEFSFTADLETLQSAKLQFYIYNKEGNGEIKVKLNGYEIFSSTASVGNRIVVNFPLNKIMQGANTVKIHITPSLSTHRYTIIDARLISEDYAPEQATVSQTFSLPAYDFRSVRDVKLNAYIIQQAESRNLKVSLNGEQIFSAVPGTNLEVSLSNNQIAEGANTLEWDVDTDGSYQIKFIRISYYGLEVKGREKAFYFDIDSDDWDRIESDNYKCELSVERSSGIDEFTLTINGDLNKLSFEGDNKFTGDMCDELTRGLNEIKISAEDDINIKQLKIKLVLK